MRSLGVVAMIALGSILGISIVNLVQEDDSGTTVTRTVTAGPRLLQPKALERPPGVNLCVPPEGKGVAGAGECPHAASPHAGSLVPPQLFTAGGWIPDVSEFQGDICWGCAKPHITGAVVRVQDNGWADSKFRRNVTALHQLGVPYAVYAFIRPAANCAFQADLAYERMTFAGVPLGGVLLVGDAEVPLPYWCVAQFNASAEFHTRLVAVDYTAPFTYPGGPHGKALLWTAQYGPFRGCVPTWPCPGGHAQSIAWQCTDGIYGCVHYIPGIGRDDVSIDEGFGALMRSGAPAPRPKPKPKPASVKLRELQRAYEIRQGRRAFLQEHHCRPAAALPRPKPRTRNYRQACAAVKHRGDLGKLNIDRLKRELHLR